MYPCGFRRRFLRTKKKQICWLVVLLLVVVYVIYKYTGFPFIKVENRDFPSLGDFSCKNSVIPNKCAFHLDMFTRDPKRGKYICALMGSMCKGFTYNTGLNLVIMKNSITGFPKYSPGIELHIKTSYIDLVNLTTEECAAPIQDQHTVESRHADMACHIPVMNPFDRSIMGLIAKKRLDCPGTSITKYDGSTLTFITEGNDLEKVTYETITRKNHDFGHGVGQTGTLTRSQNTVVLNHDAVRVIYHDSHGNKQTDFHIGVSPLQSALSRDGKEPFLPINIMIIAFDSTSRAHFIRKMPLTHRFLTEELKTFIFKGYSIVGDGTTPAMTALLAGKSEEELPEARRAKVADTVDKWPFIFNKLHDHGYVTSWSEDQSKYGTFQYRLNGFIDKPVDHYLRNFWVAASEHTHGNEYLCLGPEPAHRKRFRYLESFYKSYPQKRKFSLSFFSIGHDSVNSIGFVDEDFYQFLGNFKKSGNLDNTLLVVMGDHGIRYGAIRKTILGKLEERLPLLSMTVPDWLTEKFPDFVQNMETNTERLTTPYDVHVTLQQILAETHDNTYSHGQSLFTEIPKSRTCRDAGNPEHFCPCINWKPVDTEHKHIHQIGQETVRHINQLIMNENLTRRCSLLTLRKINMAVYLSPNDKVETFDRSADVDGRVVAKGSKPKGMCNYQAQVMTSPNNGVYEVTGHVSSRTPYVDPAMSRLDKYGDQPKCIMDRYPHMRKYCYCIS